MGFGQTREFKMTDVMPETKRIKSDRLTDNINEAPLEPLLKWAGGKEKELKYILPNLPGQINNYYEPFVGGGAVFTAIKHAGHYFINDLSFELIGMYRNIAGQNDVFFNYVKAIDETWNRAYAFFEEEKTLVDLYLRYRQGLLTRDGLKMEIECFCADKRQEITEILDIDFFLYKDILVSELTVNLFRKMSRMKVLELEKHLLPRQDLLDNIETAVKSAVYMYFRHLYNDKNIMKDDTDLHCALFLFIRNYAYSGMFRYNGKGDFNVPYGGIGYNGKSLTRKLAYYKSGKLLAHLGRTDIENLDFEKFLRSHNPSEDDFVFLDPPYDSEFCTYVQNEFTRLDQERLARYMIEECRAKWMLIIKNTDFIYNLYKRKGVNIRMFDKEYLVSFMNRNNKKVKHLLITNY